MIPSTDFGLSFAEVPAVVFLAAAILLVPLLTTVTCGLRRTTSTVVMTGLLLVLTGVLIHYFPQSVDDTFITLRYAENFAKGEGLCFNPGERVEGFSNPLWMIMLSGLAALGLNQDTADYALPLAAKLLGILCLLVNFVLVARWGLRGAARERTPWHVFIPLAWFIASGPLVVWSVCGLETALHALLLSLLVIGWGDIGDFPAIPKRPRLVISAMLLLVLSRPEGAMFSVLALGLWGRGLNDKRQTANDGCSTKHRGHLVVAVMSFALVVIGVAVFRLAYFGDWLPNTFHAKVSSGFLFQLQHGLQYLAGALLGTGGVVWMFVFRPRLNVIQLILAGEMFFILAVGGDWMFGFRFWAHVMPVAIMGMMVVLRETTFFRPLTEWREIRIVALVWVLTCVQAIAFDRVVTWQNDYFVSGFRRLDLYPSEVYYRTAQEIRKRAAPDDLLAIGEAGVIPYFTRCRIMDYHGLVDTQIAAMPGRIHEKATAQSILDRRPRFILVGPIGVDLEGNFEKPVPFLSDLLETLSTHRDYHEALRMSFFILFERNSGSPGG